MGHLAQTTGGLLSFAGLIGSGNFRLPFAVNDAREHITRQGRLFQTNADTTAPISGDCLEHVSTELNHARRASSCLSMIISENRFPLFRIML
jgi:hypothetical protein